MVSSLAYKFRAMLAEGNVVGSTDEEEAFDEARLYASRLGNIGPEILQESADRMMKTAKVFYGLWSMDPEVKPVRPLTSADPVPTQVIEEKADADTARFIIVLSKKGSMLRLHRSDGCSKAQTLSFASYEFCDVDPVPPSLYSHYCHTCWPRAPPPGEPQSGSASGSSSDDPSEEGSESSED